GTFNIPLPDTPLSRAGSLPQVERIPADRTRSTVGVSLLAMASKHSTHRCLTHRFREQARSHNLSAFLLTERDQLQE
ncbi:MAG: hypothetical protein WCC61_06735, partial [Pseudomonas sp.]|uniref:hypothetical protein n=1 Tax=Pseudomonas sp. TaxID=306 RepID=UPI003C7AC859